MDYDETKNHKDHRHCNRCRYGDYKHSERSHILVEIEGEKQNDNDRV